jgi:hypothetical protein
MCGVTFELAATTKSFTLCALSAPTVMRRETVFLLVGEHQRPPKLFNH